MNIPSDLCYSKTDEWVRVEGDTATVGITDYAQHELGEIVYLELPEVGRRVAVGAAFGVVESVKAVSDLNAPVAGEVVEVNEPLTDDPSLINDSPYDKGWMMRVKLTDSNLPADLMDASAYKEYRAPGGH